MAAKMAGSQGRKFNLGQNHDLNVTPFVDVLLVLLIIFMVTAPLATVSIKLDQPPVALPTGPVRAPTYVSIADGGRIFVSFGPTSMRESNPDRLAADVAASLGGAQPTARQVMVRADRHVRYSRFMDVMNSLHAAGYQRIGLINEKT